MMHGDALERRRTDPTYRTASGAHHKSSSGQAFARKRLWERDMNYLRTAILLAGLTALFMALGYLIGGGSGAIIALLIAAATNLFAYWNSDRMVLATYGAKEVDRNSAPELVGLVAELASRAGLPMPRVF